MAEPRVFISSTFFDLRQIRADLDLFIREVGYEAVRNETGTITYENEGPLEDSCYKEINEVEILIGIIGGRYGSASKQDSYSITGLEIKTAYRCNKQVYIFIDKAVYSEYETYLFNKGNETIKFRHVDNIKVYEFI